MGSFPQQLRADQRSNFSRKSSRASEGNELCQRAKALVYPARILQKKGAVQVPRLGLKMRGLPDLQTKM